MQMVTNGDLSFNAMPIPREELVLGYHLDDARLVMYPKKNLKNTLQQQQVFGPCGKSRVCCFKLQPVQKVYKPRLQRIESACANISATLKNKFLVFRKSKSDPFELLSCMFRYWEFKKTLLLHGKMCLHNVPETDTPE